MRSRDLMAYRKLLLDRKRELSGLVASQGVDIGQLKEENTADPLDQAVKTTSLEVMSALGDNETREIEEIDYALEKIKDGVYGKCEECHKDIAPARLQALPTARFCVSCKAKQEKTRGVYTDRAKRVIILPDEPPLSLSDEE